MTPTQFRTALRRLDLTQSAAARLVGADDRTGRRWALGERKVPECVAILLKLLVAGKITAEDVEFAKRQRKQGEWSRCEHGLRRNECGVCSIELEVK